MATKTRYSADLSQFDPAWRASQREHMRKVRKILQSTPAAELALRFGEAHRRAGEDRLMGMPRTTVAYHTAAAERAWKALRRLGY